MQIQKLLKNRVAGNTAWIIVCKVLQAILGLVISMLTARYLGPNRYGLVNYAASLALFVGPVAQLGLTSTLVHEILSVPEQEGTVLGSSILMSVVSSALCMLGISLFVRFASPEEAVTQLVCMLYSILLLAQAFELVQY